MMDVLNLLQQYLRPVSTSDELGQLPGIPLDVTNRMRLAPGAREADLPPGLPDLVRRYMVDQPSYAEGRPIPGPANPLMEQEMAARMGPRREDQLLQALGNVMNFGPSGGVMTDTLPNSMFGNTSPAYSSPLNSMMRRAPLALY